MSLKNNLNDLQTSAEKAIANAKNLQDIEALDVRFLGRKGELTALLKGLGEVTADERPALGVLANEIKSTIALMLDVAKRNLSVGALTERLAKEREDITEPGTRPPEGHLHPMTHAIREITAIFERAGFTRTRYPEVEWDWYTFEALNMPKDHPARDEQETFHVEAPEHPKWGRMILSTQATSGTARALAESQPPIRSFNITKTYRREYDITHVPMFHQIDVVYVDKDVSITHLRGLLDHFAKAFFGPNRTTRLRPHHFRFTEPSFEIDISCGVCGGTGLLVADGKEEKCRTCKRGWLELGGAGMLHPNVLKAAGIDPETYSGLAFGWGVERTYMMKEGLQLDDVRHLYKNDLRFLKQF